MKKQLRSALLIFASAGFLLSCGKQPDPEVISEEPIAEMHFMFKNFVGDQPMKLNTETYTTSYGEEFTVSRFSYYITNIKFEAQDGSVYAAPESYYLLEQEKPGSLHFHLQDVPENTYESVSFLIGVDKDRNTSGAQTGALDPIHGMFWDWNTGYIMAKMEGRSPQSKAADSTFQLHIGGFEGNFNAVRAVTLHFPSLVKVTNGHAGELVIKADANKWFAPNAVLFSETPMLMTANEKSKKIADNYAEMFSLISAGNSSE